MRWLGYKIRQLIQMWPRARKYGLKYYWDCSYRRKVKNREVNQRAKEKYGCFSENRKSILNALVYRDGRKCQWCNKVLLRKDMTVDHIVSVADGGNNKLINLRILCRECHNMKDNPKKTMTEKDNTNIMKVALSKAGLIK